MNRRLIASMALLSALLIGADGAAQADPPATPEKVESNQDAEKPKSLDELLDLDEDAESESAREAAEAEAQAELERALNEQRISDAFKDAIRQMAISAAMLGDKFDSGLATQRVQEEIIRKLDQLIEAAQQQQSSSSSSSSSSSQQQQQQSPRQQQQNQQQQSQAQQSQANNPATDSSANPPSDQSGDISSMLEEMGVEWGKLPPRQRDLLLQTLRDKPSSLYRRLTESYYRRLAEESSR